MRPEIFYPIAFVLTLSLPICAVWWLRESRLREVVSNDVRIGVMMLIVSALLLGLALWSAIDEALDGDRMATLWAFLCVLNLGFAVSGALAVVVVGRRRLADSE